MYRPSSLLRWLVSGAVMMNFALATPAFADAQKHKGKKTRVVVQTSDQRGKVRRVYVRTAPPAAVLERRTAPPGLARGHAWAPGYQKWNGTSFVWTPGRWMTAPRTNATYVPGRWQHDRNGWYYVDGYWR